MAFMASVLISIGCDQRNQLASAQKQNQVVFLAVGGGLLGAFPLFFILCAVLGGNLGTRDSL